MHEKSSLYYSLFFVIFYILLSTEKIVYKTTNNMSAQFAVMFSKVVCCTGVRKRLYVRKCKRIKHFEFLHNH